MKKRGQISVEYVLIFSVVILIAIPSIYLFRDYIVESNDRIARQNLEVAARDIIDNAREVYYLGAPSRVVIEVNMPDGVKNMYVVNKNSEYYLLFAVETMHGKKMRDFESDIKIEPAGSSACTDPPQGFDGFECKAFENRLFAPGKKELRIETKSGSSGNYVEVCEYGTAGC